MTWSIGPPQRDPRPGWSSTSGSPRYPVVLGLRASRCRSAGWRSRYRWLYQPLIISIPACSTRSPRSRCSSLLPAAARHQDPRPDQRGRGADDLHRRAAGPRGRRRLASVPDDVAQAATAMGYGRLAAARRGRAADRRAGDRGRPAGRGGRRTSAWSRVGGDDRRAGSSASCSPTASSRAILHADRRRHRACVAARAGLRRADRAGHAAAHPVAPGGAAPHDRRRSSAGSPTPRTGRARTASRPGIARAPRVLA